MELFMPAVALQNGNWAYFSPSAKALPRTIDQGASLFPCDPDQGWFPYLGSKTMAFYDWSSEVGFGWQRLLWAVSCGCGCACSSQYPLFHVLSWSWVSLLQGRTITSCESDWWHKLEMWPVVLFNKRLRTFPSSTQESFRGLQSQYC